MRALLVEPSKLYQDMVGGVFAKHDIEVSCFTAGKAAIAALAVEQFDLICTAMYLPDMQALEFCLRLRGVEATRFKPILMLTSEENKEELNRAMLAGVTEIFSKNQLDHLSIFIGEFVQRSFRKNEQHGHILYIEDSPSVAEATKAQLISLGYKVDLFSSGEPAFEMFIKGRYDLVLTDIVLDGQMTGFTLIREIRKLPGRFGEVPILAISTFDDPQRKIEILNAGASDFLLKPPLEQELAVRVANLIINRQLLDKVQRQQEQLHELAMRDELTTLYNRHYLMEVSPKVFRQAYRQKFPVCMLVIDIDHFKKINDSHGHRVGDLVLTQVGKLLRHNCREEDLAARFGGEEFVLLLPYCNLADAQSKAEAIRREIEELKPNAIVVTASIGIATQPLDKPYSFELLFEAADKAVYRAKALGRNRVEVTAD
ncbi:MAG: diguanylate cyclase [Gammaproteobacteria bacterium]|nr:diguanylate cyclase [Gammaproteobacteria bacterium]